MLVCQCHAVGAIPCHYHPWVMVHQELPRHEPGGAGKVNRMLVHAINCLFVLITRTRQPFHNMLGRTNSYHMLQVHDFFSRRWIAPIMECQLITFQSKVMTLVLGNLTPLLLKYETTTAWDTVDARYCTQTRWATLSSCSCIVRLVHLWGHLPLQDPQQWGGRTWIQHPGGSTFVLPVGQL